ncbi:hypothetical protein T265_11963 [Opisthorchis viverrini]|uniref:Uncharacterized protein n=1 Tax=Opisthorchis viverrini TaxID=6198 RepID=A0A074Z141_OPIVI|nr:hypothetical protein T265_11963 [Opisthorchis viverrini]KER19182.1 hypothetical protein T265_11963 [Opisthorchis viverrini]
MHITVNSLEFSLQHTVWHTLEHYFIGVKCAFDYWRVRRPQSSQTPETQLNEIIPSTKPVPPPQEYYGHDPYYNHDDCGPKVKIIQQIPGEPPSNYSDEEQEADDPKCIQRSGASGSLHPTTIDPESKPTSIITRRLPNRRS